VKCTSGITGDFGYKTCAPFCKSQSASTHCNYCKCKDCTFCGGGGVQPKTEGGGSRTAKASAHPPHTPKSSYPQENAEKKTAKKVKKKTAQSSAEVTPAAVTPAAVAPAAVPKETPLQPPQTGSPAAGQPAAAAPAPAPATASYLYGAMAATMLLACVLFLALRESGKPAGQVGDADGLTDANAGAISAQQRIRVLCVGFLCLQYASYALLRRYSTGILKEDWSAASVLGMGELIKFVVSLVSVGTWAGASEAPDGPVLTRLAYLVRNSGKMAVPAFIYLAMNMLGLVSLRRIDSGTFAIVQQSKIFFTALFARLMLGRSLSVPKCGALLLLVLGVCLISLLSQPAVACTLPFGGASADASEAASAAATSAAAIAAAPYTIGLLAVTADSCLSGFATIYFEKVLKTTVLTVWDRNLQLAFWSMLIYLPWALIDHPTDPLHGWSMVTVLLAMLGALGGILVALVIKHADGLAKNLATASSIVLTTLASHFLFHGPLSAPIGLACLVVIVAGYTYQKVA